MLQGILFHWDTAASSSALHQARPLIYAQAASTNDLPQAVMHSMERHCKKDALCLSAGCLRELLGTKCILSTSTRQAVTLMSAHCHVLCAGGLRGHCNTACSGCYQHAAMYPAPAGGGECGGEGDSCATMAISTFSFTRKGMPT